MIYTPFLTSPADIGEANQPLVLGSPTSVPGRRPLRHLLVGHPDDIDQAIRQLHVLTYAEQFRWSRAIAIPDNGLVITPQQGHCLRYLIRWQRCDRS